MTSKQIAGLVDTAIALDRQIATLSQELDTKKAKLLETARALLREESGIKDPIGTSYTIKGAAGNVCTVSWPKPRLIRSFYFLDIAGRDIAWRTKEDKAIELGDVRALSGLAFGRLFAQSWAPAKAFRELAQSHLDKPQASQLIQMLEEPSSPRVQFETK